MILPGKHIRQDRALISIGGDILSVLSEPAPVSDIWQNVRSLRATRPNSSPLSYDWFILSLTLLHAIYAVELKGDKIVPAKRRT
ncbi:ABC-three component system middle component 6 [Microvirga sp. VF16]|jgi:hypothetical protein|uniref:ABC-three component system middle component 6 n=1 Tax=Microvirga sp. VF16 TaxID=2807101 RepID=UPI0035302319